MKDIKSFLNNFKKENKKNNFIKNWKFEEVEETEKLEKMEEKKELKGTKKLEERKINKEKLKEVGLIITALVLIGIGYVNFSDNKSLLKSDNETVQTFAKSNNNIGDVELVNSDAILVENDNVKTENEVSNNSITENEGLNQGNNITGNEILNQIGNETNESNIENTNLSTNNTTMETVSNNESYFSELKLNRNNMYSQMLDTYQKIVDSPSISSEQKAIAIQEIEKINSTQNSISVAEELIKLKGFENVVIYVNRRVCECSS